MTHWNFQIPFGKVSTSGVGSPLTPVHCDIIYLLQAVGSHFFTFKKLQHPGGTMVVRLPLQGRAKARLTGLF